MNKAFLDTAFAIAVSVSTDAFHAKAVQLAGQLKKDNTPLITTRGVMLEIGNALSKPRYRRAAAALLQSLENDPNVEVVPLSEELYARAFLLYQQRADKEWGLVDCVSFIIMQERGVKDALTTDEHFRQAGFHVLMRDP